MIPPDILEGFMADLARRGRIRIETLVTIWTAATMTKLGLPLNGRDAEQVKQELRELANERH